MIISLAILLTRPSSMTRVGGMRASVDPSPSLHARLFSLGSAAFEAGNLKQAQTYFLEALDADPSHAATKLIIRKFDKLAIEDADGPQGGETPVEEALYSFGSFGYDGHISVRVLADARQAQRTVGSLWQSAPHLVKWLMETSDGGRLLEEKVHGKRVLELGAGLGLVGTALAKLGAAHVTLTDLPQWLPLLHRNLAANFEEEDLGASGRIVAAALPWGVSTPPLRQGPSSSYDLVVATDVT